MKQKKSPTPEKQLLRLIEDSKEDGDSFFHKARLKRKARKFFSWNAFRGIFSFFKSNFRGSLKGREWSWQDLKNVNKALSLAVFLIFLFSGIRLYFSINEMQMGINKESLTDKEAKALQPPAIRPLSSYLESVRSRNVFAMVEEKAPKAKGDAGKQALAEEIAGIKKRYNLVGISWSEDPDLILEDTKAEKTFFLKRGQTVGDLKVQAIFRDKVILNFKGTELEFE